MGLSRREGFNHRQAILKHRPAPGQVGERSAFFHGSGTLYLKERLCSKHVRSIMKEYLDVRRERTVVRDTM